MANSKRKKIEGVIQGGAPDPSKIKSLAMARAINQRVNMMVNEVFADRLGASFFKRSGSGGARRNIYDSLGYIKDLTFNDFYARFKRGDIAKRIIKAPVDAAWRLDPVIAEIRPKEESKIGMVKDRTPFEQAWMDLTKKIPVYHYLERADRIAGIGEYGVILLGFDDGLEFDQPVQKKTGLKLIYVMPYMQSNAGIASWDTDIQSPRYGLPEMYEISMRAFSSASSADSGKKKVHHSRIIHLAEETTENDVFGTPRLECVYNRLQDLELVAGGSGEMFWRGALPGFNFKIDSDADDSGIDTEDLKSQIERYIHGLDRVFRTKGMDVQSLSPQVSSPKDHVDIQITLISAASGIPRRILEGSERGELASSQDETNWLSRVDERRSSYVGPMIVRAFVQRLIDYEVLPAPKEGFSVIWPDLFSPAAKDQAEIGLKRTQALAAYVQADGADQILPINIFLRDMMGYDDDEVEEISSYIEAMIKEREMNEVEDEVGDDNNPPIPEEEDEDLN